MACEMHSRVVRVTTILRTIPKLTTWDDHGRSKYSEYDQAQEALDRRALAGARACRFARGSARTSRRATYSGDDSADLPSELATAFSGSEEGATKRSLRRIERRHGLSLDDDLVR